MFEFHGWLSVWTCDPIEGPLLPDFAEAMTTAMATIRSRIAANQLDLANDWLECRETTNGQVVVAAHGYRNHRRDYALDLFKWVAAQYRHSYGVLYTHDAEDSVRDNEFTVHRFARGAVQELHDRVLSPIVPNLRPASE